jgi:membrane associated rhomboid family serine protease
MVSIFDDFRHAWNSPNNGLIQLIIVNIAVFVALGVLYVITTLTGIEPVFLWVFRQFTIPAPITEFLTRPWTLITYSFAHSLTNPLHIIMNLLVLYWFGRVFTEYLGSRRLINLYILGAIAGALTYLLAYNIIPFYAKRAEVFSGMVGASAAVFAISVAIATHLPDHRFFLLFFGPVKIKYLVAIYIFFSFLGSIGQNAGGNLAHLGGALMGYLYAVQLRRGHEWGTFVMRIGDFVKALFRPRPKIKVSHRNRPAGRASHNTNVAQEEIDAILDKIAERGYESLSAEEKQKLFNASKK